MINSVVNRFVRHMRTIPFYSGVTSVWMDYAWIARIREVHSRSCRRAGLAWRLREGAAD